MIKIKVLKKTDYIKKNLKYKNYDVYELIAILNTSIDMLRNDFELSDNDIWNLLKDYRKNWEEVED